MISCRHLSEIECQVAPAQIDNLLLRCEGVVQVGVAGVPAAVIQGFVPRAFVVKKTGSLLSEEDVVNFVDGTNLAVHRARTGSECAYE